jgi:dihydroorotase-like cyclic amidohydrolase
MKKLWDYINDGTVDFIGSDHSPFLLSEKEKGLTDIFTAAAGSPCIELTLPLMLTAVRDGRLTLPRAVELLSENAARIFGLFPKKGVLRPGADADFVVVDMKTPFEVSNENLLTHAKAIGVQYNGTKLVGRPLHTAVRGRMVMKDGVVDPEAKGWGQRLYPQK